ncbi:PTS N-acetylgalactosamine transporter subunit IIA [Salmonella enterica]|nr:PTS N-acetylgalactosamine transporter subunit IIA [Salmonella enterica]
MKIAIVVASNGLVAKELLHVAEDTVGHVGNISAIDFHNGESLDELLGCYKAAILRLNAQHGILFLIAGENSCHQFIASQFLREYNNSQIIIGVNLTMLVSLMLYENNETDIQLLTLKAQQYGKNAIHAVNVKTYEGDNEIFDDTI